MNATILSLPEAPATPDVRFGRQSALRSRVFSEVVLFKEKQIPAPSSRSKCHIPSWWQEGIRPSPAKLRLIISKLHIPGWSQTEGFPAHRVRLWENPVSKMTPSLTLLSLLSLFLDLLQLLHQFLLFPFNLLLLLFCHLTFLLFIFQQSTRKGERRNGTGYQGHMEALGSPRPSSTDPLVPTHLTYLGLVRQDHSPFSLYSCTHIIAPHGLVCSEPCQFVPVSGGPTWTPSSSTTQ